MCAIWMTSLKMCLWDHNEMEGFALTASHSLRGAVPSWSPNTHLKTCYPIRKYIGIDMHVYVYNIVVWLNVLGFFLFGTYYWIVGSITEQQALYNEADPLTKWNLFVLIHLLHALVNRNHAVHLLLTLDNRHHAKRVSEGEPLRRKATTWEFVIAV